MSVAFSTRFDRDFTHQLASNIRTFADPYSNLRQDGVSNVDFSALRSSGIREKPSLEFRGELFNLFNHPLFNAPNLTPTSSIFGLLTSQSNLSRRTQLALRLVWQAFTAALMENADRFRRMYHADDGMALRPVYGACKSGGNWR
jgi:hypothetical protein